MEDVLDILQEQSVNNRAYETRIDGKKNRTTTGAAESSLKILLMTNAFRHKVPVEYVQGQIFEYEHIVPFRVHGRKM